jgi:N-acetylglucosamine malate deacetylase 1
MIDWSRQRVLIIAPHPDDEVLGCGGLISRVKRAGGEVFVLWVTAADIADFSPAGRSTLRQRLDEIAATAKYWPLDGWHLALPGQQYNLRLDSLPRGTLIDLLERSEHGLTLDALRPTVIIGPDPTSYNQDHQAVAEAMTSALRPGPETLRHQPSLVLAYEQVADAWTSQTPVPRTVFVELAVEDINRKIEALRLHASQWRDHPHTHSETALRGMAAVRGAQSGYPHAEAFGCLRWRT